MKNLDLEKIKKGEIRNLYRADLTGANLTGANYGGFMVINTPIQLMIMKYTILIFRKEGYIQAGCHLKTVKEWEDITVFEDQEFLDKWKAKILAFAR